MGIKERREREQQIVDASAIEKTFGPYATPLDEALNVTISWYREHTK